MVMAGSGRGMTWGKPPCPQPGRGVTGDDRRQACQLVRCAHRGRRMDFWGPPSRRGYPSIGGDSPRYKYRGAEAVLPAVFLIRLKGSRLHRLPVSSCRGSSISPRSVWCSLSFQGHRFPVKSAEGSSSRKDRESVVCIEDHRRRQVEGTDGDAQLREGRQLVPGVFRAQPQRAHE